VPPSNGGAKRGNFVGAGSASNQSPTPVNPRPHGRHPLVKALATEELSIHRSRMPRYLFRAPGFRLQEIVDG
jgi:hypothetical protein